MTERLERYLRFSGDRRRGANLRQQGSSWRSLAMLLGGAGLLHLGRPATFDSIVPERLPGSARFYTYASGVAELSLAVGLILPRTRRLTGVCTALFFLAVFPANVKMALDTWAHQRSSRARKITVLARLPLQIPLVAAALNVSRSAIH